MVAMAETEGMVAKEETEAKVGTEAMEETVGRAEKVPTRCCSRCSPKRFQCYNSVEVPA